MLIDVKKANLNGMVPRDEFVYVNLPDGRVWRLRRWLYGIRLAAQGWEEDYSAKLGSLGFVRGRSAPTVFYRSATGCRCIVHGDDFTFLRFEDDATKIVEAMRVWYDLKVRGILGGETGNDEEVTILNRTMRWMGASSNTKLTRNMHRLLSKRWV